MNLRKRILAIPFERRILINQQIAPNFSDGIIQKVFEMNKSSSEPILIAINTTGGHFDEAHVLFDIFKNFSKAPVIGMGLSKIFSAGLIVLLGCKEKYCLASSFVYFHNPEFVTETKIKTTTDLVNYQKFLNRHQEGLVDTKKKFMKLVLENSHLSEDALIELMNAGAFVSAEELLRLKLINGIIS